MTEYLLDGRCMPSRAQAHGYIAGVLNLPAYYGANLDALADCLGELSRDVTLTLIHPDAMRQSLGDYAPRLERVFEDLAEDVGFTWRVEEA